jgi:hypothetical protein
VRVVYQFVEEVVEQRTLDDFLKDLDVLATTPEDRGGLCGPSTGETFSYNTGLARGKPTADLVQK